jgi:DNA-binding response OmpR family regulator
LEDNDPDLVIADWTLRDGTAYELLTNTRDTLPYPVIVMTAQGTQEIAVKAMKAGALDYVIKSDTAFAEMPHAANVL